MLGGLYAADVSQISGTKKKNVENFASKLFFFHQFKQQEVKKRMEESESDQGFFPLALHANSLTVL